MSWTALDRVVTRFCDGGEELSDSMNVGLIEKF
jgi:hypothetical protein